MGKVILITGAAGFIGSAIAKKLIIEDATVIGLDNINDYYDVNLKKARLESIAKIASEKKRNWFFYRISLSDRDKLNSIFSEFKPSIVLNMAAQAGVRYSLENPHAYIESNINGFCNLLEACRENKVEHLIYASSSSVYGGNKNMPFTESQGVDHPISLYAATKKSNELMAHSYSHLFALPCTGLRFFTVYGPWGRPDMAPMIFAKAILGGKPIKIFNYGKMKRDFTFIDDIVNALYLCCSKPATINPNFDALVPDPSSSFCPHRVFNIGNSQPIELLKFISVLENSLGIEAIKDYQPIQKGDVIATAADTSALEKWIGFRSKVDIKIGVKKFADWYKSFYH